MTAAQRQATSRALILPAALLLLGAAWFGPRLARVESRPAAPAHDSPEACVARLLVAEERGDVNAYLECLSVKLRKDHEMTWRGQSPSQVSAELRGHVDGMVGRVIADVTYADPDHAGLALERIFRDHRLRQRLDLVSGDGRWQIAGVSVGEWQRPPVPYGTPVFTTR